MRETLFTKIIAREIPADIVYEDDRSLAFRDIAPQAPTHVLVIPKEPIESIDALAPEHADLAGHLMLVCQKIAAQEGLTNGYRVITNIGEEGGQTVDHLHLHVLGGKPLSWPPG
ncbi:HIT-like protein HinT [Planctomycetes bacterium MalM25]|nr:HIT-like protein HinT [Planctomycetes bacterium MalM25]